MARFSYRARGSDGRLLVGMAEGVSQDAVADRLTADGATPLDIRLLAQQGEGLKLPQRPPSLAEMALFARQLHALTKAGVPIIRSLNQLRDTARNERLAAALREVVEDLEAGRDLAGAMARHPKIFSPLFVAMVRVGEESGRLDEAFNQMFRYMEHERATINQIKSALRYPMFVMAAVGVAIFVLMAYVIPVFAQVFSRFGLELPLVTRIIIGGSNFTATWWWAILLGAAGAVLGFRYYIATEAGRLWWDRLKLRLPAVGDLILRASLGRFSRAFAMASRSGVPLLQALSVVSRAVDNAWLGEKIQGMRAGIERGESIARTAALAGVFTPLVLQMISVGEETGQVDEMLQEVAEYYENEVEYDVRRMGEIIQPLLVVAVGLIVFVLALGVFLPMWDLTQIARR